MFKGICGIASRQSGADILSRGVYEIKSEEMCDEAFDSLIEFFSGKVIEITDKAYYGLKNVAEELMCEELLEVIGTFEPPAADPLNPSAASSEEVEALQSEVWALKKRLHAQERMCGSLRVENMQIRKSLAANEENAVRKLTEFQSVIDELRNEIRTLRKDVADSAAKKAEGMDASKPTPEESPKSEQKTKETKPQQRRPRTGERPPLAKVTLVEGEDVTKFVRQNDDEAHIEGNVDMGWEEMFTEEEHTGIQLAVFDNNWEAPSKIQIQAIQYMAGPDPKDLLAQAPSGSGKTAAFLISTMMKIKKEEKKLQAICLFHTRELLLQTARVFECLNYYCKITHGLCGNNLPEPPKDCQIIFGTAPSVMGALKERKVKDSEGKEVTVPPLDLSNLKLLVIDEADEIVLNRTHSIPLRMIMTNDIVKKTQVAFFSATYPDAAMKIIKGWRPAISEIRLTRKELMVPTVQHYFCRCSEDPKNPEQSLAVLAKLYRTLAVGQAVVFTRTDKEAEMIRAKLAAEGLTSFCLSGMVPAEERDRVVQDFHEDNIKVLIATDIIARGFDVPKTFLVVNWSVPRIWDEKEYKFGGPEPWLYYHRAGRAGRFGKPGLCFTFTRTEYEERCLKSIAGQFGMELKVVKQTELATIQGE